MHNPYRHFRSRREHCPCWCTAIPQHQEYHRWQPTVLPIYHKIQGLSGPCTSWRWNRPSDNSPLPQPSRRRCLPSATAFRGRGICGHYLPHPTRQDKIPVRSELHLVQTAPPALPPAHFWHRNRYRRRS